MRDINMIIDEIEYIYNLPELTGEEGETINYIKKSIINAIIPFKKSLKNPDINSELNENGLTQIFVQCVDFQLLQLCNNISVGAQYYDTFFKTTGIPDFYFYKREETVKRAALFVVESKRLPSPSKATSEYVIGGKNNGGIERFKIEKHGKGLSPSGMLGFLEEQTFLSWHKTLNSCIQGEAKSDKTWKDDEILNMIENNNDYCKLKSIVHRKFENMDITLYHWWVTV
jgi:hypothetical protein